MVLEYLQRAAFFHGSPQTSNVEKGQQYNGTSQRPLSKSSQQLSLLSPVAQILKTASDVVNNAVLHVRDGLTEEQRAAERRKEERNQILHLRLKNVRSSSGIKD
jgi:TAG lipase / steryl ester hydrolase / phospholipase A2 / LPA acyltransferase